MGFLSNVKTCMDLGRRKDIGQPKRLYNGRLVSNLSQCMALTTP